MDQLARFEAAGFDVQAIDGHDYEAIAEAIARAQVFGSSRSLIACRTIIGKGAPNLQGTEKTHGAPLGDSEIAAARQAIDWPHRPFEVPEDIIENLAQSWHVAVRTSGANGVCE